MNEELKKLRRSVNVAEAKIAFLKEGVDGLGEAFKDISADLDDFITIYSETQQRNEERFERIEKHIGL